MRARKRNKTDTCEGGGSYMFSVNELQNFCIGVSDISPADVTPISGNQPNYPICTFHEGVFVDSTRDVFPCDEEIKGRYVVVQMKTSTKKLVLCEVEVYKRELG